LTPEPGIIVTGASKGIGGAIALELARGGATVACVSRSGSAPEGDPGDGAFVPYACDVTDGDSVRRVVEEFAAAAGGIRGLVNNAGGHVSGDAATVTPDQMRTMFELNCVSALVFSQAARPHLAESKGLIIGIGSFYDKLGPRRSIAYSASKAALASVNRTLAVEWARDGIRVLTVAPGYVPTDLNADWLADPDTRSKVERLIPVRRLGEPREIGRLVALLMLERIGFLTGETIYIDGAQSVKE
jgi:NAD(P)-dependent dehydrogenase (short-subunit alcohol dehydrogenase family)